MRFVPLILVLTACPKTPPEPVQPEVAAQQPLPAPAPAEPEDPYHVGLDDAMYPLPSETVDTLLPLVPDTPGLVWNDGKVLVTTWSRSKYYDEAYVEGYEFELYGETWFTAGTELADRCAGLSGDELSLRVEQILGLPAGGGRDVFVQMWIDPAALFRPCAEPDVTASSCSLAGPLKGEEDSVWWQCDPEDPDPHARWLCSTWVNRYGSADVSNRYPWTALGYTYDWGKPEDPVGPSEFVAPKGTPVILHALVSNDDFCP